MGKTNIQPFAQHHPFNYSYTRDSKPSWPRGENPLVFETFLREFIEKPTRFSHYREKTLFIKKTLFKKRKIPIQTKDGTYPYISIYVRTTKKEKRL